VEIKVSPFAGFCYGVQRAVDMACKAASQGPLYSLGPLIHNPLVVAELEKKGIKVVSSLDEIPDGEAVLFRAHGVEKEKEEKARMRGIKVIDTTCPFVKNAQEKAELLYKEGYQVIIFGEKEHPEVRSILSYTDKSAFIMSHADEIGQSELQKAGVVSQTTRNREAFSSFCAEIVSSSVESRIYNTICLATKERQEDARRLAGETDFMIVVGGRNSANTRKLFEIVSAVKPAVLVESADELRVDELTNYDTIGITAGASTPDTTIRELIVLLKTYFGG